MSGSPNEVPVVPSTDGVHAVSQSDSAAEAALAAVVGTGPEEAAGAALVTAPAATATAGMLWTGWAKQPSLSSWQCSITRTALGLLIRRVEDVRRRGSSLPDSLRPALCAWIAATYALSPSSSSSASSPCTSAGTAVLRAGFERWRLVAEARSRALMAEEAKQLSQTNASLEQRIAKLKGLLAKVHQANQKHSEESSAVRRERQEVVRERESLRSREDQERRALELQLRDRDIESAFQQDVEIAIQRAAQAMSESYSITQQQIAKPALTADTDAPGEAVDTSVGPIEAKLGSSDEVRLRSLEAEVGALEARAREAQAQAEASAHRLAASQRELAAERALVASLRRQVEDEVALRKDVEAELRIVAAGNKVAADQAEIALTVATNARVLELTESTNTLNAQVETLKRKNRELQLQIERSGKESSSMRRSLQGLLALERENKQLHVVLKEFRRMCGGSPPSSASALSDQQTALAAHTSGGSTEENRRALELGAYAARAWSFMESLEDLRKELFLQNLSFSSLSMEPGRHPLLWPWTAAAAGMRTSEEEEPELSSVNGMWRRVTDRRASSVKALATSTIRFLDEICIGLRKKEASGIDHALSTAPATSMPAPDAPMMWEAHAFTLAAGKDLGIPIPEVPAGAKEATLEWVLWGDGVSYVQLSMAELGAASSSAATSVVSTAVNASEVAVAVSAMRVSSGPQHSNTASSGAMALDPADGISGAVRLPPGTSGKLFKMTNSAMWYSATFSYLVRLSFDAVTPAIAPPATTTPPETNVAFENREKSVAELVSAINLAKTNIDAAVRRYETTRDDLGARAEELEGSLRVHGAKAWDQVPYLMAALKYVSAAESDAVMRGYRSGPSSASCNTAFGGGAALRHIEVALNSQIKHSSSFSKAPVLAESARIEAGRQDGYGSDSQQQQSLHFAAESLVVAAGADFRLPAARVHEGSVVKVTWDFNIVEGDGGAAALDIGFAVLLRRQDGTLPLAVPYRRCVASSSSSPEKSSSTFTVTEQDATVVILFDNTYSWLTPKKIRYSVSIDFTAPQLRPSSPSAMVPHTNQNSQPGAAEDGSPSGGGGMNGAPFAVLPLFASAIAADGDVEGGVEARVAGAFRSRVNDILRVWAEVQSAAAAEAEALASLEALCNAGGIGCDSDSSTSTYSASSAGSGVGVAASKLSTVLRTMLSS